MTIEDKIKNLILGQYGTVSAFTKAIGMPNSTFATIMKIGIEKSSIQNVIKICHALKISTDELAKGNIVSVEEKTTEPIDLTQFIQIVKYKMDDPESVVLDGQHLTAGEAEFFMDSLDLIIEQLRRKRK